MHIAEIPSFFTPYGGEFCLEQSRALAARGHRVAIISNVQLSIKKSITEFVKLPRNRFWHKADGIDIYQSYMRGVPKAVQWNARRWVKIVESMFDEYVALHGKPDILHAHCCKWAGYAAMLLSKKHGIPYVITEHLPSQIYLREFGDRPREAWQVPLLRTALEQADRVITVSDELVDDLAPIFGREYRHTTVSNTIDTDFFAYRERTPRSGRPYVFCCPAINDRRKGYDVLLDAFSRLNKNTRLLIAGRGTNSDGFRQWIAASPRCADVELLGELDKTGVREMLYRSDALAFATRNESQGLVVLEAVSTGIPVITTDAIPCNTRIDGAVHIVPVDETGAFTQAMNDLMEAPEYDGKPYSQAVADRVSPTIIGEKIEQVLNDAVAYHTI